MLDPVSLDAAFPTTTMRVVELFTTTRPRVVALRDIARTIVERRGSETVSAEIYDEALNVLGATRRVVSRQRGARGLLELRTAPDWTTLLTKLELALVALATFQTEFSDFDEDFGAAVWRDETWRELHVRGGEFVSTDSGLYES